MTLGRDLAEFSFGPFSFTLGKLLFESAGSLFYRDYGCDALLQKQSESVGFGALLIIFFVYLGYLKDCV